MSDFPQVVVLFGATGMLGKHISEAISDDVDLICPTRNMMRTLRPVRTEGSCRAAIINVAAMRYRASTFMQDQDEISRQNIAITDAVYQFAINNGITEVRQATSSAVYEVGCKVMDDDVLYDLRSPTYAKYCRAKRYAEMVASVMHITYGINTITFRPTSMYGPFDSLDEAEAHVVPAFIMRAIRRDPEFVIRGNPALKRDFVYAGDVAAAFVESLKLQGVHTEVNVATGKQTSIRNLAVACMKAAASWRYIRVDPGLYRAEPRPLATTAKLKLLLPDLPPFRSLDAGLAETMAWYEKKLRRVA